MQTEENNLASSTSILAEVYFPLAQFLHLGELSDVLLDFRGRDAGNIATLPWHEKTKKASVKTVS